MNHIDHSVDEGPEFSYNLTGRFGGTPTETQEAMDAFNAASAILEAHRKIVLARRREQNQPAADVSRYRARWTR